MTTETNTTTTTTDSLLRENEELKQRVEAAEIESSNLFNLLAIIREISSVTEFDALLVTILDVLVGVVGSFRHSIVLTDENNKMEIVIQKHGDDIISVPKPINDWGIITSSIESRELFYCEDLSEAKETDIIACIPLFFEDTHIGVIVLHELLPQKSQFDDSDIEILNLISQQAGIAIVSAKQFETTKKVADRKESIIKRIQEISFLISSSQDILESFNIILETIKELLGSDIVTLMLYDEIDDKLVLRHALGIDEDCINNYSLKGGVGLAGYVHKTRSSLLIKNVKEELHFSHLIESEDVKLYGNSILSTPILVKNKSIGTITVSSSNPSTIFDVEEKNLLTTIGSQIAFALDNLYLNERLQDELMNMSNLFIASNQLHSTLDLSEIYMIAEELLVNFIGADKYSLFTFDSQKKTASMVLSKGFNMENFQDIPVVEDTGKFSDALFTGESFIADEGNAEDVTINGKNFSLVVSIPLLVVNKIAGVILISSLLPHKKELVSFDREMFDLMAQHTATAIIAAQLYAKSEQRLTTLYDITRLLSTNINVTESIKTIVNMIEGALGLDKAKCGVYLHHKETGKKTIIASTGCSEEDLSDILEHDDFNDHKISLFEITEGGKVLGRLFVGLASDSLGVKEEKMLLAVTLMISEILSFETHLDISKKLAVQLDKEKKQSKAIVDGVSDGLMVVNVEGKVLLINPIIETLLDVTEEEVMFKDLSSFFDNRDLLEIIGNTSDKGSQSREISVLKDGNDIFFNVVTSIVKDERNANFGIVSVFHDITQEKDLERVRNEYVVKLKKISVTDALTGVYNRGYLESRFASEFKRAQRVKANLSCMILDIDKFKNVNDTYGHNVGDDMIVYISKVLTQQVRESDIVTRFGGDEFVVILPDTTPEDAKMVAERIRISANHEEFALDDKKLKITVSIGIAGYVEGKTENYEAILKNADLGLYKSKEGGRNKVEIFDIEQ